MKVQKENSLARLRFTGGIIGLLAGSQFVRLQKVIAVKNSAGWNVVEVLPEDRNLIVWVFRIVLLVLTLGLWTLSTGYILIFERPSGAGQTPLVKTSNSPVPANARREPVLSAPGRPA